MYEMLLSTATTTLICITCCNVPIGMNKLPVLLIFACATTKRNFASFSAVAIQLPFNSILAVATKSYVLDLFFMHPFIRFEIA